jgi:hypothetical protein
MDIWRFSLSVSGLNILKYAIMDTMVVASSEETTPMLMLSTMFIYSSSRPSIRMTVVLQILQMAA